MSQVLFLIRTKFERQKKSYNDFPANFLQFFHFKTPRLII